MTYEPLQSNVLVEKIKQEQNTPLIITQSPREPSRAIVIAVGQGDVNYDGKIRPMIVKPDDIVYFFESDAVNLTLENKEYLMIDEDEILLIEKA